jgi:hypothetical protein
MKVAGCSVALPDDAEFKVVADATLIADAKMTVGDKTAALQLRFQAADRLFRMDIANEAKWFKLRQQIASQQAAEQQKMEREIAAEKRKQGVSIGMSQEEVLASSWGRPRHVNRTTTARGTREQWIYNAGYREKGAALDLFSLPRRSAPVAYIGSTASADMPNERASLRVVAVEPILGSLCDPLWRPVARRPRHRSSYRSNAPARCAPNP